ncbi:MAG: hypothetical protein KatS3mg131_0276 [Candidatus Tectimicrobiota bacterium]|nr:MAG: hypothetical protein KatS3mg131_0276 [Candidatus Tectomicrobia bacterium]
MPTLLVCGQRETRFMPLRAFAAGEQVVDTPAGHAVDLEAAAAFNAATCPFLRQHRE